MHKLNILDFVKADVLKLYKMNGLEESRVVVAISLPTS